ncbi:MAG: DEAD/DEAH box helicase [Gammaproteobacteria bacterium]|nr:MAG: DEAD/DEAH box helicase [Gammaproteobacteria bacterium]TND02256.1 MAG: DEAD/DEAH box helicase [Gammaproteobacteria bacterium]
MRAGLNQTTIIFPYHLLTFVVIQLNVCRIAADGVFIVSFTELKLNAKLLQAIEATGFTSPTDIQRQAIPLVMAGRDLMASAQTGTGKTAAFVLPILQRLMNPATVKGNGPRALILAPTRELAMQVSDNIRQLSRFCRMTSGSIVGGMAYGPQIQMLRRPLDILVATPGRLMDHMEQGLVNFSRIEVLVLDEADRMLDMGFIDAVKTIATATPTERQTLLFSATLEGKVLEISRKLLNNPAQIQLAANKDQHASITQQIHQADDIHHKHSLLAHVLTRDELSQAVIFTSTKRGADKLAKTLATKGHASAALHGDMSQGARKRTVDSMRHGKFRLLVATDVAARGLDIKGISHVINFDLPMVAEDYIHRIGRTGRAGATGIAISLVGPDDWSKLAGIERLTGNKMNREIIAGLEPKLPEPRGNGGNKPAFRGRKGNGSSRGRSFGKSANGRSESHGNSHGNSGSNGNGPNVSYRTNNKPGQRPRRPSTRSRSTAG